MSLPVLDSPQHVAANGIYEGAKCMPPPSRYINNYTPSHSSLSTAVTMAFTTSTSATPGSVDISTTNSPSNPFSIMSSNNTSMSTLPEAAVDQHPSWHPTPSQSLQMPIPPRPQADLASPSPPYSSAMGEALAKAKTPGLIRRLSRGAHNRLRRRASTTQTNRFRDQSAGPVLMRRRSDSTGNSDFAGDMSELELEPPSEDNVEDGAASIVSAEPVNGLGIATPGTPRRSTASSFDGGIALTISAILEQGTLMTKYTRKKRKQIKLRLDTSTAKVIWDANNPLKQFYIDDVREIRIGAEARNSRQDIQVPIEKENSWMTILYDRPKNNTKDRNIKTMHLVADNDFIVKLWTDALRSVERERIEIMNALSTNVKKSEKSMQMAWRHAMNRKTSSEEQKIDFEDAKFICSKLEINCSIDTIRSYFNKADRDLVGMLNYQQYESFIGFFKARKDIKAIYDAIKPAEEAEVGLESFLLFLRDHQGVDIDRDRRAWEIKFEYYARFNGTRGYDTPPASAAPVRMSLQAFQNFMLSGANNVLVHAKTDVLLDRPFNEYYISSSHNTYLLGRQVAGDSSVEGYIIALVKGCRCIEVDCWDGKDGRPRVNHGRSLTTEVLFEDCISVISKYAFASTTYPLIVSLEVHCNAEQQAAMVEIICRIFGDALVREPLMTNTLTLPTPEELRNRILIKVKGTHQPDETSAMSVPQPPGGRSRSHSSPFSRGSPMDHATWPMSPPAAQSSTPDSPYQKTGFAWSSGRANSAVTSSVNVAYTSSSASESEITSPSVGGRKKRATSRIIPALGALGVYLCGVKYAGFEVPEARLFNHIISFAETSFNNACNRADRKHQLEKHNVRYMMRVYPAARRIDSSNFNPLQPWRRGVQMAALNWQTYDINLQMNEAMFAAGNDRHGYVLKPDELRLARNLEVPEPVLENQLTTGKRGTKFVKFSVEIISAQRLPRPNNRSPDHPINPYVEFEMFFADDRSRGIARSEGGQDASARDGTVGLGTPLRKRTKIIEGNGFDPIWNQPISMTVETKYDSLIFVRWTVWNSPDGRNLSSNSTMLAHFTAKLSSLQQGYRHLPLVNSYGERYRDAKLFVKIKKDAPIPLNNSMHIEEQSLSGGEMSGSPHLDPSNRDKSWPRRIFNRTPSQRKKSRDPSPLETSFSRTSSIERPLL